MARIEVKCPKCGKHKAVISEKPIKGTTLIIQKYECGHWSTIKREKVSKKRDSRWNDLYPYQRQTVEFIEKTNFNCLITHEMGLGKTPIAISSLRYNPNLLPVLVICPAGHIYNWQREFRQWFFDKPEFKSIDYLPLVHTNTLCGFPEDFKIHIVSNAIISRKEILESAKTYGFKTVVVDEAHNFKNDNSKRTKALIQIAQTIPHKILLTGTPILNRTSEMFNLLHLVKPQQWLHKGYLLRLCVYDYRTGKYLGISPSYKDFFLETTKDYIFGLSKKDVFKDLPPLIRSTHSVDIRNKKNVVDAYNKIADELDWALKKVAAGQKDAYSNILALMAKIRHITALAKIPHVVDYVMEFLQENPDQKIAIGVHHRLVIDTLMSAFKEFNPVMITNETAKIKDQREDVFRNDPKCRVLIASVIGAGEGRNLQFCKNVVIAERQWNLAKELQFEGRFWARGVNPEKSAEETPTFVTYINAIETIDEFFADMVELKGHISNSIKKDFETDADIMIELARQVVSKRLKYVGA